MLVVEIHPADILKAFVVGLLLVGLAMALTAWALWPERHAEDVDAAQELPRTPQRARRRPFRTGVVHVPQQPVSDDVTVVMPRVPDGDR